MSEINIKIDINEYLSESEKEEIAKDEYRRLIREGLLHDNFRDKTSDKLKRRQNLDRILSNAVYDILENESEEILGERIDLHKIIKENVEKTILNKKDYSYTVFQRKDTFTASDSLGYKIIDETILENKDKMKAIIIEKMNQGLDKISEVELDELIRDSLTDIIVEKLKS